MITLNKMPLRISYESRSFPAGTIAGGFAELQMDWALLIWAALTVGRPNWHYVFANGNSSYYEALFRISLLRMAIEQNGPTGRRLRRPAAARNLDPSEKGAVNYFMGMTICKLFASQLLNAPWALHVDVFGASVGALLTQRSRPDLLAQITGTNEWISLESKGRISPPDAPAKVRAKAQARRIAIAGAKMRHYVGCITFLRNDVIQFFWEDPVSDEQKDIAEVPKDAWRYYYAPIVALIRRGEMTKTTNGQIVYIVAEAEMSVGAHPEVEKLLLTERWNEAKILCERIAPELAAGGYTPDGLQIMPAASWSEKSNYPRKLDQEPEV